MPIYQRLNAAFRKRYENELPKSKIQEMCIEFWKSLKSTYLNLVDLNKAAEEKTRKLNQKATRRSAGLLTYFAQASKNAAKCNETPNPECLVVSSDFVEKDVSKESENICVPSSSSSSQRSSESFKPRQDELKKEIMVLESELNCLLIKRNAGLTSSADQRKIKDLDQKLKILKKKLKAKEERAVWQKNYRKRQREYLKDVKRKLPEAASIITVKNVAGRPLAENRQEGLLEAIREIAIHSGSADDKRRSEALRACLTLDRLCDKLAEMDYEISRTTVYRRLLPRNFATTEGKRHIKTVPVKLCRAQSDLHRDHMDQRFCKATINSLEEVASILGPQQVWFISQDEKAKVPLGMTAAKAQAPILMHLKYKVRLPDHDWAVGSRHKLTPSVYAGIVIKENCMGNKEAVTYSGPTYIAIRSGKHSSSTASTHANDLEKLIELDDFNSLVKQADGKTKPVLMLSVDGGPDENPRYKKVIAHAVVTFRKHDLDAIFIFTNAPGRSAFNRVERKMAVLSRALSGLVLPHDAYGNHLDGNGRTVDLYLEKKNFEHAGNTLAEIWSELRIDGYNVVAEFIPIEEITVEPNVVKDLWYSNHVRESQYCLQIIKCHESSCCLPYRSSLKQVIYQRFLPAPFPLSQQPFEIPSPENHKSESFATFLLRQTVALRPKYSQYKTIPYDLYCPSVQLEINKRTCSICGIYFASKDSIVQHRNNVHRREDNVSRVRPLKVFCRRPGELLCHFSNDSIEWIDVELLDIDNEDIPIDPTLESSMPIIKSIETWVKESNQFLEE